MDAAGAAELSEDEQTPLKSWAAHGNGQPTSPILATTDQSSFITRQCRMDANIPSSGAAVWVGFLMSALQSIVKAAMLLVLFVLYPVYRIVRCLIPRTIRQWTFDKLFALGYGCYQRCWHVCDCCTSAGDGEGAPSTDRFTHASPFGDAHTRSCESSCIMGATTVWPVPLTHFEDNWGYIIVDNATGDAAVVDPGSPIQVLHMIEELGVNLTTVLTTHGHHDHAGGNVELCRRHQGLTVVGPHGDKVPGLNRAVAEGDSIMLGQTTFGVLETPGHTCGHIVFTVVDPQGAARAAFTGDALFIGGAGVQFEADSKYEQTLSTINKLSSLPLDCLLFVGHEYSERLLWTAAWIEPSNPKVVDRAHLVSTQRAVGRATVPSTVSLELATNPYLRLHSVGLQQAVATRLSQLHERSCIEQALGAMPLEWMQSELKIPLKTDPGIGTLNAKESLGLLFKLRSAMGEWAPESDFSLVAAKPSGGGLQTQCDKDVVRDLENGWEATEAIFTSDMVYLKRSVKP